MPELMKMLSQAEDKNRALENKIKVLTSEIQHVEKEFDQENTSPQRSNLQFDDLDKQMRQNPIQTSRLTEMSMFTQDSVNASFLSI